MSDEGFVDVLGALEPKTIASEIAANAHGRAAETVVLAVGWLEEQDNGLNQMQKIELTRTLGICFDGFEADVIGLLREEFGRIRMRTDA